MWYRLTSSATLLNVTEEVSMGIQETQLTARAKPSKTRKEAEAAFEAALVHRYGMSAGERSWPKVFAKEVAKLRLGPWVHGSRPNRGQVLLMRVTGTMEWYQVRTGQRDLPSPMWKNFLLADPQGRDQQVIALHETGLLSDEQVYALWMTPAEKEEFLRQQADKQMEEHDRDREYREILKRDGVRIKKVLHQTADVTWLKPDYFG